MHCHVADRNYYFLIVANLLLKCIARVDNTVRNVRNKKEDENF